MDIPTNLTISSEDNIDDIMGIPTLTAGHQRRESKLLLEGVEYDLSNLLVKGDCEDMTDSSVSSSSSSSEYISCPSRAPSRNWSNASSVFDEQPQKRESPYRFDLEAMRTLMTSFRGIPDESSKRESLLKGEDISLDTPERCSLRYSSTSSTEEDEQLNTPDEDDLSDLIYDEQTGTYVYKEDLMNESSHYHDACESPPEHQRRYTLEEMCMSAEIDDGEFDDEEHEMEISPGVYVPFRGAKETWQAVATHCTVELQCLECSLDLICINDCEFTVCPDCRVVNPVFSSSIENTKPVGVGMGFKKEWVLNKLLALESKQPAERRKAYKQC